MNTRIIPNFAILMVTAALLVLWPSQKVQAFSCTQAQRTACGNAFGLCRTSCGPPESNIPCLDKCDAQFNACIASCGGAATSQSTISSGGSDGVVTLKMRNDRLFAFSELGSSPQPDTSINDRSSSRGNSPRDAKSTSQDSAFLVQ